MAEMIGAMVMARAVDDIDLSDEILEATLQDLTGHPTPSEMRGGQSGPRPARPTKYLIR
jgi:hypothetical protein